jgi:succinate dehydrogenase / fumarate reductase cytochrome b subunit
VLWLVRLSLLGCAAIHVWAFVTLHLENTAARGPEKYGVNQWLKAAVASRYMRQSGIVVGLFIVYHILHFTVGIAGASTFKSQLPEYHMTSEFHVLGVPLVPKYEEPACAETKTTASAAQKSTVCQAGKKPAPGEVHDVYSMVYLGFSSPIVSIAYIIAIGMLTLHIWHGADSMFQTLGLRNEKWSSCLRRAIGLLSIVYFLGNLAMPGAILAKLICPPANTAAAKVCADGCCGKAATSCPATPATKK